MPKNMTKIMQSGECNHNGPLNRHLVLAESF